MNRYPWKYLLLAVVACSPVAQARIGLSPQRQEEIQQLSLMPEVRVLLHENVTSVLLEAKEGYVVSDSRDTVINAQNSGKRFVIHAMADGLRWGEVFPAVQRITLKPQSEDSYIFVNGIQYAGVVHIYRLDSHRITVVNELSVDDYLKSCLALRFDKTLAKEALSAFVIAERTDLVEKIKSMQNKDLCWHVTAKEGHYLGYAITRRDNGIDAAVDWTACMVLDRIGTLTPIDLSVLNPESMDSLARSGMNAKQILDTIYPDSKLVVLKTDFSIDTRYIG